jgi:murein hydrolase activator
MNELQTINTQMAAYTIAVQKRIDELREGLASIEIRDEDTKAGAQTLAKSAADLLKDIELRRKEITTPILAKKKEVDDYFKSLASPLEKENADVRRKLAAYADELEKRRLAELHRIEDERRKAEQERREAEEWKNQMRTKAGAGEKTAEQLERERMAEERARSEEELRAEMQREEIRKQTETKNIRTIWKFVVEDADRVPREYCAPIDKLIREAINKNPNIEIPGVRKWREKSAVLR